MDSGRDRKLEGRLAPVPIFHPKPSSLLLRLRRGEPEVQSLAGEKAKREPLQRNNQAKQK